MIFDNGDLTHEPVVNKCCSSAKWVPIEVLEEGYSKKPRSEHEARSAECERSSVFVHDESKS